MKQTLAPLYQKVIQNLPIGKSSASQVLGFVIGSKVKAVVNQASMSLDLREVIQRQMFLGRYEPTQTEWFKECIKKGDTFIDVGANFGHYTTLGASLVGQEGRGFAFEPSPVANQIIEEMIKESNIQNVMLIKSAVGKENGTVNLFLPNTRYLHSPSILTSDPSFVPLQIPVITLDTFEPLKIVDQIKLIKIDVEGYEPDVVDGMNDLLREGRVLNIFCEFNSWWLEQNSTTSKQLLERFLDYGYKIHKYTELQEGLEGHKGVSYNLQDIWFKLPQN